MWGATQLPCHEHNQNRQFQSTLPVWGATEAEKLPGVRPAISIHAPRVGSDGTAPAPGSQRSISIHAPRVGSDDFFDEEVTVLGHFNPRSPCGERPEASVEILKKSLISIHAPRVGSDHHQRLGHQARLDFNPRSPCGERRTSNRGPAQGCGFQSTLPVWGATAPQPSGRMAGRISIHAPRVGSDVVAASL